MLTEISFLLLLFLLHHYFVLVGVGSILGIADWLFGRTKIFDVRWVGTGHREMQENMKNYVLPVTSKEDRGWDLIKENIESKSSPAVLYTGKTGSGKTTLGTWVVWQMTSQEECQTYGWKLERAIIFSPKTMEIENHDFALPNFTRIDMTRFVPSNPFERKFSFVGAILTSCYSDVNLRGMMFKGVERQIHRILTENKVETWDDFEEAIRRAKAKRNEFNTTILEAIEGDIMFLKSVGTGSNLNIDWNNLQTNYVLDFGGFDENEVAKVFFMEYYLRVLFSHRLQNVIMIDESHRLLNKSESSIISKVLREGRTTVKLHLLTQNISDVPPANMQFGTIFLHESQNNEDYKYPDAFILDYYKLLRGHRFLDATWEHSNQLIPIFELNPKRLDAVRHEVRERWLEECKKEEEQRRPYENGQQENADEKKEAENNGFDKEKTGVEIIRIVDDSPIGLWISAVIDALGYKRREKDSLRGRAYRLIDGMAKEEKGQKIRIKDYVSVDGRHHKLVFSKNNPQRAETQVHRRIKGDTKQVLENMKAKFEESQINQGCDFELEKCRIEAESGLKKSLGDFQKKVEGSDKKVIVVLCNEKDLERYSYLPVAQNGKAILTLLPGLKSVIRSLEK